MTRGHHCRQRRSAAGTAFGIMINHNWIYSIANGLIRDLEVTVSRPEEL
jgi:hypothetical protein